MNAKMAKMIVIAMLLVKIYQAVSAAYVIMGLLVMVKPVMISMNVHQTSIIVMLWLTASILTVGLTVNAKLDIEAMVSHALT